MSKYSTKFKVGDEVGWKPANSALCRYGVVVSKEEYLAKNYEPSSSDSTKAVLMNFPDGGVHKEYGWMPETEVMPKLQAQIHDLLYGKK